MAPPRPSRLLRSASIGSLAIAALCGPLAASGSAFAVTPAAAPASAVDAVTPAAVSAWVTAIEHDAGRIAITGTAYTGEEVTVSGPGVVTTTVRADWNGVFTATAVVDGYGAHEIAVTSATGGSTTVRATTEADPKGGLFVSAGAHDATLASFGAWKPGATVEIVIDGHLVDATRVDGAGKWAYRYDGLPYGQHIIEARSVYDGAVQWALRQVKTFVATTGVDATDVDLRAGTVSVSGTGEDDTMISFASDGAPIETVDGQQSVAVLDGVWAAELPLPGPGARFWTIDVTATDILSNTAVGSTEARATIPLAFTATVDVAKPKKLVLSGTGELNANLAFTDAAGAPILDKDGQPVTGSVGAGTWTRTLDPRRFDGGSVTITATVDGHFVGASTVTFR